MYLNMSSYSSSTCLFVLQAILYEFVFCESYENVYRVKKPRTKPRPKPNITQAKANRTEHPVNSKEYLKITCCTSHTRTKTRKKRASIYIQLILQFQQNGRRMFDGKGVSRACMRAGCPIRKLRHSLSSFPIAQTRYS